MHKNVPSSSVPSNRPVLERFLRYVRIHTTSCEDSNTAPSSACQWTLAKLLQKELSELGITDAVISPYGCVYGHLPATPGFEAAPAIGLIAHMDTAPDCSGENVAPQIHENYDGGDLPLSENGPILSLSDFPHLPLLSGRTLITTDGKTLLGADDKAGIAEILTAIEKLLSEKIPHGKICVAFTPDEEVGRGTEQFDLEAFGADYAYTVDGGREGEIVYENFNAGAAVLQFHGKSVHPGSAKGVMRNALLLAMEFDGLLPKGQRPSDTEGYQGFWHLTDLTGDVSQAVMHYIIRDHDATVFEERMQTIDNLAQKMNEHYGDTVVTVELSRQYRNMAEKILPCPHLIDTAKEVIEGLGLTVSTEPIRGGTDGARLSYLGLPCPNLGTGGYAYHGPFEHITVEGMELASEILFGILVRYAGMDKNAL